jgi:hypothetical protein
MSTVPGGPSGDEAAVSFERDIKPLFRPMDIECMRSRNVFLIDYDYMKDPGNAQDVLDMLKPTGYPRMPYGGPYWSQESLDLFQEWIDQGRQP